jgi:4'-phosphopantetheinyl transferase
MGIILNKSAGSDGFICVWQLDGSEQPYLETAAFLAGEKERIMAMRSPLKRSQSVAVRLLINKMSQHATNRLEYDEYNRPLLPASVWNISISHSHDKIAVIVDETARPGVDIELIDPKIERIAHKFMSAGELRNLSAKYRIEELFVHWAAKEALYKMHGKKGLHFIGDLLVHQFTYDPSGGVINGSITTGEEKGTYELCYEKTGSHMLVYRSKWVSCWPP